MLQSKKILFVKPLDIVIILLAFLLTGFSAYKIYGEKKNTSQILIRGSGNEWIFPPGATETVIIPGPLGNTIVKMENNQIWVESSPCLNQVCTGAGRIKTQGEWISCLPNNVFILIKGIAENEVDGSVW